MWGVGPTMGLSTAGLLVTAALGDITADSGDIQWQSLPAKALHTDPERVEVAAAVLSP